MGDDYRHKNISLASSLSTAIGGLTGVSPVYLEVVQKIPYHASRNHPLVLLGEKGTGKETFARVIHSFASHILDPFLVINGATVAKPRHLGHLGVPAKVEPNRHGGALVARGRTYSRGTIFVKNADQLGQDHLHFVRNLIHRFHRRRGGKRLSFISARIMLSLGSDLPHDRIQEIIFALSRHEFGFYTLRLPPIRERYEDIPLLAARFASTYGTTYKKEAHHLSSKSYQKLLAYDWPGNIPELQHVIINAVLESPTLLIQPYHIHFNSSRFLTQELVQQQG